MYKPKYAKAKVKRFGYLLGNERKNRFISQEFLAKKASVNTQTIKRIESGKNVTLLTIFKVAKALNINIASIIDKTNVID